MSWYVWEKRIPERLAAPYREFERFLGGREKLCELLWMGELTDAEGLLVDMIGDPLNRRASLARVCLPLGVSFVALLRLCAKCRSAPARQPVA